MAKTKLILTQENRDELLDQLEKANNEIARFRLLYQEGLKVVYGGQDESDDIFSGSHT